MMLSMEKHMNSPSSPPQLEMKLNHVLVSIRLNEMKLFCLNEITTSLPFRVKLWLGLFFKVKNYVFKDKFE